MSFLVAIAQMFAILHRSRSSIVVVYASSHPRLPHLCVCPGPPSSHSHVQNSRTALGLQRDCTEIYLMGICQTLSLLTEWWRSWQTAMERRAHFLECNTIISNWSIFTTLESNPYRDAHVDRWHQEEIRNDLIGKKVSPNQLRVLSQTHQNLWHFHSVQRKCE